ncbi:hypothetical protein EMIHUDRAFT_465529 [Emiliania huxleyi CCMP1516]|uniref:Vacuolar protein sorting-associated protein 29 n=2 Tax=Emiliania huxleyi TaxID=2903 RepID=A0A0D3IBG1_EMIH1|nr:hypothetical protein EMIHUDRAFT_465529 [Emiliania huxleyi CCMP1516]EOD08596.1 hypothetical protein EMIHUDRAFT_465529 [Emiliania huxleyi CCMP1516]|eukprot:XP_005761025.1 hypothetical protein EMIHUDRAFT_465529 [Emiliania huxleyi CCMP1516]
MAHSTVGIISDTHGSIAAWTKALSAFRAAGVEHILHAGDVIGEKKGETVSSLLAELREVAPVTAVRGNTDDRYDGGHGCPTTATYEDSVSGVRCFVHHGDLIAHKDDEVVLSELRPPGGWRPKGDIIVYGHTHVPRLERHPSGVLFLNPGSTSGKHMPGKLCPKQAALLDCLPGGAVAVRVVALGGGEASISEWEPVDMAPPATRLHSCDVAGGHNYVYENISSPARSAEASSAARKRKGSSSSSSSAVSESEQTRKALQRARQQEALALRAEGKEYTPTKRQRKRKPKERRKWDERAASKLQACHAAAAPPRRLDAACAHRRGVRQAKRELGKKLRKEKKGAPEVVVVPIFWKGQAGQRGKAGKRVEVDAGHKYTPGQKFAHWEHRGTMLRVEVGPRESERGCCTVARTFTPGEPAHRVEQVQVEAEGLVAELERLAALKEEERDAAAERAAADKGMTHNGSWKIAAVGGRGKSSAAAAAPPSESAAEAPARSAEPTRKRAKVVKF